MLHDDTSSASRSKCTSEEVKDFVRTVYGRNIKIDNVAKKTFDNDVTRIIHSEES